MKTIILRTVFITTALVLLMTSCNNSKAAKEDAVSEAQEGLIEANDDLVEAKLDSIEDFNQFKASILLKLAENEKNIGALKLKRNTKGIAAQNIDQVTIDQLEKRNTDLKNKIENYEEGPAQKWALFKIDFNQELDAVGTSISEMAARNMKK